MRCRSASAAPLAVLQPRRLAPARDGALEFGVEPDAPHCCAPVEQPLLLLHAGAVDGGVVRGLRRPGACEPDFLAGIHSPFGGPLPSFGHAAAGERQDLERVAPGSGGRGLGDEPVADPGVHGPPGGVGVSAEAGLGQIAVRDGAVDADVGEPARAPFGEGGGPAVPARGVFSAVAVPHALAIAAGWRGGPRVRFDRAVEHLLAPHRPSAARPETAFRHWERRHGMDDLPRRGRAGRGHGFARGLALAVPREHEVGDLLRVGGGAADLAGVLLECGDPALDVRGAPRSGRGRRPRARPSSWR